MKMKTISEKGAHARAVAFENLPGSVLDALGAYSDAHKDARGFRPRRRYHWLAVMLDVPAFLAAVRAEVADLEAEMRANALRAREERALRKLAERRERDALRAKLAALGLSRVERFDALAL